jgi:polyhydroxybutyrate depolymerase
VDGVERTYWLAPPAAPAAPLLVVLHGSGIDGRVMATWTGLATRGPEAGFTTVFPDAVSEVWDDAGHGRKDGVDDAAFVRALVGCLAPPGGTAVLAGLSNGAFFAERLARHGLVDAAGIALVAGTAREASRRTEPRPGRAVAALLIEGTADPLVPYRGGRGTGPMGWMARRRARRHLVESGGRETVAAEVVAADWAAANGCTPEPSVESVPGAPGASGGLAAERLHWTAPGRPSVDLYRVIGGGHGWPGGPQYAPARLVGRIDGYLDATGIVLDFARAVAG